MIKLDLIPTWVYWVAIGGLLLAVGGQQVRVANLKTELAEVRQEFADQKTAAAKAETKHAEELRVLQTQHAKAQKENLDEYESKLEASRVALVAERARNDRLRNQTQRYTTIAPATGQSGVDAATIQDAQRRLTALGSVLQEARGLVEEAGGIIRDRDTQVAALKRIIRDDRMTCSGSVALQLFTDEIFVATRIDGGPQGP